MVDALQGFVTWRHPHVTVSEICTTSSSPVYLVQLLAVQLTTISHSDYCQIAACDLREPQTHETSSLQAGHVHHLCMDRTA